MKYFIRVLLAAFLITTPAQLFAQFGYTTNTDGTLTITGYTGPGGNITFPTSINGLTVSGISSYVIRNNSTVTSVVIPGSITNLGSSTFYMCQGMTNAILGYGITSVPEYMFASCVNLAKIVIPTNVTSIGYAAFLECGLTQFTVPSGVTSIPEVFGDCFALTNVTLPLGLTSMSYAFYGCSNLPGVIIPSAVTDIDGAFDFCSNLTNIVIPNGVTSFDENTFRNCSSLGSITIPANVTSIPAADPAHGDFGAFAGCTHLTNLVILGAPNIGTNAFAGNNSLKSVYLAGGVVGQYAFQGCESLTTLTFGNLPISLASVCFEGSPITSLYIPSNITYIPNNGFAACALTNLVIAAGVEELEDFSIIQNHQLNNVLFLGNAPYVPSGGDQGPFTDCPATVYYLPGTTGWGPIFGKTAYSSGVPTALWNPGINTSDGHFGATNGMFGFNITNGSTTNLPVSILACTNLLNPVWTPLTNIMLTNTYYFTDPQWSNHPNRFYGLGFP